MQIDSASSTLPLAEQVEENEDDTKAGETLDQRDYDRWADDGGNNLDY